MAGPVDQRVRPFAWRSIGGTIWGHKTRDDDEALYDRAALDAAVAAERCAALVELRAGPIRTGAYDALIAAAAEIRGNDREAATRHAIVRAAAEIGKTQGVI